VKDLGGDSFGAKNLPEVLLGEIAGFHQVPEILLRAGPAKREAAPFVDECALRVTGLETF